MHVTPTHTRRIDGLCVKVFADRAGMGAAAAAAVAAEMRRLLAAQPGVRMVFAAAPSQAEFLQALIATPGLDWSRVTAFHMDEYVGLSANAPQGFGNWLKERLFDKLPFGAVHLIDGNAPDIAAECERYAKLLREAPADIACLGIGENGHIAFNDPPVADFDDPTLVKVVELEDRCRRQQVNDGCFTSLELVPRFAVTLTIPALVGARFVSIVVPAPTKATAVHDTLLGPVATACPASVLRRHPAASLFLDAASAARFLGAAKQT